MSSPFSLLDRPTDAPALIDATAGRVWAQDELVDLVDRTAARLRTGERELVFCLCSGDVASVVGYLAAIRAGHAVGLLETNARPELTNALIERYEPGFVLHAG